MAKQVVNTDRITISANKLRSANSNIITAFDRVKSKMKLLDAWKGAAGTAAQTTKYKLYNNSNELSKVLQNYTNLLEQRINPAYVNTEDVNKKLADKFK